MRILHVFDHSVPIQDGYSYRSLNILQHQRKLGWETLQLTSAKHGRSPAAVEQVDGLTFHRTLPSNADWAKLPVLDQWSIVSTLRPRLDELIRCERPDLIHAHSPALNGLAAALSARRHGLPLVYEVRAFWEDAAVDNGACREGDLRYRLTRMLESQVLRRADAVTCICQGLYRDIVARGLAAEKVTVIPNAIDPGQFATTRAFDTALAGELGLTPGMTIGFVGSFYAYEGLALLLEAMPRILQRLPSVSVLLVGGGAQDRQLREQAAALGLQHAVKFTGRVPHAEVGKYYDLIDVLVYPRLSLRITELVTPLKPLEAMAQGRLVVASDVGGHRELIEHERTGMLFRADDSAALALSVCALLETPARWPALAAEGRRYVERERNWEASVARYREVYAAALRKGPKTLAAKGAAAR